MTIDEFYEINVPTDSTVPQSVKDAFVEIHDHLLRLGERINALEDRIEALE